MTCAATRALMFDLLLKFRLMVVKFGPSSDSLAGMVPERLLLRTDTHTHTRTEICRDTLC
jgi:hypothetical protein